MLILDEATSSLDIPSERLVQAGLARLLQATSAAGTAGGPAAAARAEGSVRAAGAAGAPSRDGGRTALIIAHRLSTVETVDRVLVIHDGQVVEDGTPAELIGGGGRFADLHGAWKDSLV